MEVKRTNIPLGRGMVPLPYSREHRSSLSWQLRHRRYHQSSEQYDRHNGVRRLLLLLYHDGKFLYDNFNKYYELDANATARSKLILFPIMAAAVYGTYEVVQYLESVDVELKILSDLVPLDRELWSRDCVTRLPVQ
ncbi:hypothetical protein K449DRAFT_435598 [Hypoxylon sp. EC38]|nr:hypothetical protein K449DRAFT_435598 [Hypoxylon sp. EC38]